jgi:hypothetical protein
MNGYALLTLKLAAGLSYRRKGCEDEAFADFDAVAARGIPSEEGGETVLLYAPRSLIRFDDADGPRALREPGRPDAFGVSGEPGCERKTGIPADEAAAPRIVLEPGLYAFMQWRVRDAASIREGIEFYARETWWEGLSIVGPWILRRVAEEGKIATQLLGRLEEALKARS